MIGRASVYGKPGGWYGIRKTNRQTGETSNSNCEVGRRIIGGFGDINRRSFRIRQTGEVPMDVVLASPPCQGSYRVPVGYARNLLT